MKPARSPNGFIKIERRLMRTPIYTALSVYAKALLPDMMYGFTGSNNGDISYGVAQAARWMRCSTRTARRALAELRAAGLIEVTKLGSFALKAGARRGAATTWRLTFVGAPKSSGQRQ